MVNHEPFQAKGRLLDVLFQHRIEVLPLPFERVDLSIQEHLSVLYFLLSYESRSWDSLLIPSCGPSELVLSLLLLVLGILNFAVRLAVKNHLRPSVVFFENTHDVLVVEVGHRRGVHESAVLHAVLFEFLLLFFGDIESFEDLIVLELKTGFGRTILNNTQNLEVENRVLDEASISANVLIRDFWLANIAFVLDLDEINFDDESAHFDNMPDDIIRRHSLQQLNGVVRSKIVDFLINFPDDLQVWPEHL